MNARWHLPRKAAFTLVEIIIALGIASFCLLVLLSLMSIGLASNQTSFQETAASSILAAAISDLYATPPSKPPGTEMKSTQFKITIPGSPAPTAPVISTLYFGDVGDVSTSPLPSSRFRLTVSANSPSSGAGARSATMLNLRVSWPAAVPVDKAAGKVETFVALNRN